MGSASRRYSESILYLVYLTIIAACMIAPADHGEGVDVFSWVVLGIGCLIAIVGFVGEVGTGGSGADAG